MKIHDIQRKRFRGSSPGTEIRQKFVEWVRNLRVIEEPQADKSDSRHIEPRATRILEATPPVPESEEKEDVTSVV